LVPAAFSGLETVAEEGEQGTLVEVLSEVIQRERKALEKELAG